MWIIYRNYGQEYRRFIVCTTEGLAESQFLHNKELGNDVVMLKFNKTSPDIISLQAMEEILTAEREKIHV